MRLLSEFHGPHTKSPNRERALPTTLSARSTLPPKAAITKMANRGVRKHEHLGHLRPSPRSPANYWALGSRMSCPGRMSPDPPCLPGRSLPAGPAPLLLLPSLGLAFRQHTARRAANRLYSPSRLCLFATHSPRAARRRHFLAVFGHSCILSWRVPLPKGYLRPESPRALTRLRPPPACYRYYPSPREFPSDSSGCSPRSDRSAWLPSAAARSIPPASRPVRERTP